MLSTTTFTTIILNGIPPFTYSYDFGDSSTQSGAGYTAVHTYQAAGSYTAQVTVTDAVGAVHYLQKNVIVADLSAVNGYQDSLQSDADQVKSAADGDEMTGLLADAQDNVEKTLEAVSTADDTTKTQIQTSVQTKVEELVKNTDTNLDTLVQNHKVTAQEYQKISDGLGGVISNMVKNGVPITEDTLAATQSISGTLYEQTVADVLANENLTQAEIDAAKTDPASAQILFSSKPHLLDDVLDTSGIQVNTEEEFDVEDMNLVATDQGLTQLQSGKLYSAIEPTMNVDLAIVAGTGVNAKTIAEFAAEIYDTYYGKILKTYTVEEITGNLLLAFTDGSYVSFLIAKAYIKPDSLPLDLYDLPNGNTLGITDTYAMEFATYPVFASQLVANIIGSGLEPSLIKEGGLNVELGPKTTLSAKMGWEYLDANSLNALTTVFSVIGGSDPSAEAYSLLVQYGTGKSQLMPPSISALDGMTGLAVWSLNLQMPTETASQI